MDHYLVWRYQEEGSELESRYYKYTSYSDAVRLYMYSFLTTPGCGNKVSGATIPVSFICDQRFVCVCTFSFLRKASLLALYFLERARNHGRAMYLLSREQCHI